MAPVLLICAGLLGVSSPDPTDYQAAAARAGKDAGAHLKLAKWCEAHGMDAERLQHLAAALARDPQNAAARGMMGLVAYGGKWLSPEKVGEAVKADEAMAAKLAEYEGKRQAAPDTAEAQWQLALWCEQNGLKPEAMAHFTAVTQIDPNRADAWHKLGCEFSNGRWISKEQADAERAEDQAQWKADMHWEPLLMRWKNDLMYVGPHRDQAMAALNAVSDPRAVPSIHRVLATGNRTQQEMAALMFSRIPCRASSHALVGLALFDSWPEGRAFAIRELKRRDPREFMDELIGRLHHPFEVHVTPVGPQGEPGSLLIDGEQRQIQRVYQPFQTDASRGRRRGHYAHQLDPVTAIQDSTWRAMQRDIAVVERFNARIQDANRFVVATLTEITGEPFGDDPDAWLTWWNDKLGYRYERTASRSKATTRQSVPVGFRLHYSCFAAGTPVATLTGPRPIESLAVGDVVLSQDAETGVLSYQPIVGVHHNPPAETLRIRLKDETVVSTPVHRFWRPGRGWAMARGLSRGDSIRTVSGRAEVVEIRPDAVQPVYNLDVARNHSFFVGAGKLLVRDNSLPPAMFTPFDAEPALAEIGDEHTGPSEEREDEIPPSRASNRVLEAGSIWDSAGASSAQHKASMLGPRTVEPTGRSPW
jgi:tetratricopeptide (TPR) repeat protein